MTPQPTIIYEDKNLVALNKPAGLLVIRLIVMAGKNYPFTHYDVLGFNPTESEAKALKDIMRHFYFISAALFSDT